MVPMEFAKSRAMGASVVCLPTCQRAKSVPTFHFYVPTCPCQRRANFPTWRASVSNYLGSPTQAGHNPRRSQYSFYVFFIRVLYTYSLYY